MARIKYYYDTETCRYERMRANIWELLFNILGFIVLSFIFAFVLMQSYAYFFDTHKEAAIRRENEELKANLETINHKLGAINHSLELLQKKDRDIYRLIFEAEPFEAMDSAKIKHHEHYDLQDMSTSLVLIDRTNAKIEEVNKLLKFQQLSYDEIIKMAGNKEKMIASLPAIRPLKNQDVSSLASGFGMRIHPIYKVLKMHTGLDFSAKIGTPVHATGDGVIAMISDKALEGYGNQIEIDHGYGMKTKYAHLSRFNTSLGKRVKRGEVIGFVGNTGTSSAPHLHYEIIRNGKKVDPIHYFYNDLTPLEYQKMIEISSQENQSLGGE
ncbi:MAG TPA: M23 family metallopeptidase [Cytophagales bacterium]|nr:M23 family metallopeptidase [Cytophagales bacterium]